MGRIRRALRSLLNPRGRTLADPSEDISLVATGLGLVSFPLVTLTTILALAVGLAGAVLPLLVAFTIASLVPTVIWAMVADVNGTPLEPFKKAGQDLFEIRLLVRKELKGDEEAESMLRQAAKLYDDTLFKLAELRKAFPSKSAYEEDSEGKPESLDPFLSRAEKAAGDLSTLMEGTLTTLKERVAEKKAAAELPGELARAKARDPQRERAISEFDESAARIERQADSLKGTLVYVSDEVRSQAAARAELTELVNVKLAGTDGVRAADAERA